jgi:hypothetical protein
MMPGHERLILFPDGLYDAIEPLLPQESPAPKRGRPRVPERAAFGSLVFILRDWLARAIATEGAGPRQRFNPLTTIARLAGSRCLATEAREAPPTVG